MEMNKSTLGKDECLASYYRDGNSELHYGYIITMMGIMLVIQQLPLWDPTWDIKLP